MATNNAINQKDPQVCFLVRPSATLTDVTGDGTLVTAAFNEILFDNTLSYNTGTYVFTAPVTGYFLLSTSLMLGGVDAVHRNSIIKIVTTGRAYSNYLVRASTLRDSGNIEAFRLTCIARMTLGDASYVAINVSTSAKTIDILTTSAASPDSWFSGYLIR